MNTRNRMKEKMDVEVRIELGHKAWKNIKPTIEGYTHDWTVFVQGVNGTDIKHFVEKVIFHLPNSYPDSKQIKERPPFILSESTSRSFSMQIDIFFCAGAKLNKVTYNYDISISDEVVNNSWERKLTFPNPSKNFLEKLLLAGGKMVDLQKTSEMNVPLVKCKVEPDEETEVIKVIDNAQILNSSVQNINNLNELLKENEGLKSANAEVKEKTDCQEKLLDFYDKKLSSCETCILAANKSINQLRKKIEEDENEISTLKLQVQILQNELLQIKNLPTKNSEGKMKGKKRKRKNKRKFKYICSSKSSTSNLQNTSLIKTDTFVSDSSNTVSESHYHSQSNSQVQSFNDNSSFQQNICGEGNFETSNCLGNVSSSPCSFKSENTCIDVKSVEKSSINVNADLNISKIRNNATEKSVNRTLMEVNSFLCISEMRNEVDEQIKINSTAVNTSLDEHKIRNCDIEEPVRIKECGGIAQDSLPESSLEVDAPLNISNFKNCDIKKPECQNSMEVDSSLYLSEINNNDVQMHVEGSSVEVNSLIVPEIANNVEKSVEGNPITANAVLNKFNIKHTDVEKSVYRSLMEVDSSLYISEINNNNVENSVAKNSVTINALSDKSEIGKSNIEACRKCNNAEKPLKESSAEEANVSLGKPETKNINEKKIIEGMSNEVTMPLNKSELFGNIKKPIEGSLIEAQLCIKKELVEETPGASVKKHVSSIQGTDMKSFNSESKENDEKHISFGDVKFSSSILRDTEFKKKQNKTFQKDSLQNLGNVFKKENLNINIICKEVQQDVNDATVPNFIEFITDNYQKLKIELGRIKHSKFRKFRHKTNPLFYKLGNINSNITDKYFMRYIRSLTDFFITPKTSFDMATIVYLIVNYLSKSKINPKNLRTYVHNQEMYVFLPRSENCIVSTLFEIEKKLVPYLHGLIRNILNIIRRVLVSKKQMDVKGLASLCRVFMSLCKQNNDRLEPLFLCCELLRLRIPLAPYLINSLAAVWREPFYLYNQFLAEEKLLLGSIIYGMKEKPSLMNSELWRQTCILSTTNFPCPVLVDRYDAIQFLTEKIDSRCDEGLFEDLWMLTSPLIIFISNETWDSKIYFRNKYILPNLLHFSKCFNEKAFDVFCNLYVDIFSFCRESPFEELQKYFTNNALYEGALVQDCAAIALWKYIGITDTTIPASLRDWFLRNQNNSKLEVIIDIYCKRVMESHDKLLLWDDIIIFDADYEQFHILYSYIQMSSYCKCATV
ncbi:Protein AF-9 like protein [Argiope bruennichi]|uniref:Protein AF-9 like protein n=1 Tax=Argiope bruennichi TaxID=94029 RepID=A0A8T0FEV7_ARGBR|nr:Protein AF-9 like protein [Argiope bruennichi]